MKKNGFLYCLALKNIKILKKNYYDKKKYFKKKYIWIFL